MGLPDFKSGVPSERAAGGFDSHALPPFLIDFIDIFLLFSVPDSFQLGETESTFYPKWLSSRIAPLLHTFSPNQGARGRWPSEHRGSNSHTH